MSSTAFTVRTWIFGFAFAGSFLLACGVPFEPQGRRARTNTAPPDLPTAAADSAPGEGDDGAEALPEDEPPAETEAAPRIVDSTLSPERPAFQTKSSSQIASSIRVCVGSGATTVSSAMILGGGGGAFLTTDFATGQDVVTAQQSAFDGNADALKTGVRIDQITLEYITALKNTGNVVGYRCAQGLVADPAMCTCDTFPTAYAMLSRCLGGVIDVSSPAVAQMASEFAAACAASKGTAVASLVASAAFAKLP